MDTQKKATEGVDLITVIEGKQGTAVLVNGHTYQVSDTGVLQNVRPPDAQKLLQGKGWQKWDGRPPHEVLADYRRTKKAEQQQRHDHAVQKNEQKGIKELVHEALRELGIDPDALRAANAARTAEALLGTSVPQVSTPVPSTPVPPPKLEEPAVDETDVPKLIDTWEIPAEGDEWPDPSENMPVAYLRAMAEAYDVQIPGNIGPKKLVARIQEAMYRE